MEYRDYWEQQVPKSKLTRCSGGWVRKLASSLWPEKGLRKERKGGTNQLGGPYWLYKIRENLSKRSFHSIFFFKYLNFEAFINPLIFQAEKPPPLASVASECQVLCLTGSSILQGIELLSYKGVDAYTQGVPQIGINQNGGFLLRHRQL